MSSGSTTNYSLSYPVSTDPVDVAGDIKDLADDLDAFLTAPAFINNLAINGGSLVTSALTANLFNTNATTLNIGGAATVLNIGNASGQVNFTGDVNVATGKSYEINNVSVLNATTLGSSIVTSSLTAVGTISTGTWNATTIAVNRGGTGITSFGTGVAIWLETPSSANLAAAITDETGSGALVFSNSPSLTTPNIGVATGTSFNSITGLSSTSPEMNGTVAVGTGTTVARADHVHPADTSRASLSGATFTGVSSGVSPTAEGSNGFRNITMSTSAPTGGADGDVWLVYS